MNETILTLKPGITLIEEGSQVGLVLNGYARFAKDEQQAEILRALVKRPQWIESLMALLRACEGPSKNDNEISLIIAEFILGFGEFLES